MLQDIRRRYGVVCRNCCLKKFLIEKKIVRMIEFSLETRNKIIINELVINGILLTLAKVFKIDQHVLALVAGLISFGPKFLWYSNFSSWLSSERLLVQFSRYA